MTPKKKKLDPIEDAVATWLFRRYDEKLRKGRAAHEWHGDARGLLAEIKRATSAQAALNARPTQSQPLLSLGDLLRIRAAREQE